MRDANDMDLLRQYAGGNSDNAFEALVSRHVNLVYSAALRKTGNPHAAEEITQAVFIILAQKAGHIPQKTILPGWLYQTARLTASSYLKRETRRARREQEAYMQTELHTSESDEAWSQLAPLLDDAMGQLGEKDRAAVVLRFFGGKSFAEVGTTAGVSENAAKKRVIHGLEKLRRYFAKRGVTPTTAIIAAALSAHSVQAAPLALATSVTVLAVAKGAAAGGSTLTLITGALKLMAWTKAKAAAAIFAAVLLTAGTATVGVKIVHSMRAQPDIRGAWEGVIKTQVGAKLRVVLKVAKNNGDYMATLDSIDQRATEVPIGKITYDYPSVRFEMPSIGGSYDGKFNANASEMSGKWKQLGATMPLRLKLTTEPTPIPELLTESDYTPRAGSDLQGYWKGTLKAGTGSLRLAFKISEGKDGKFAAEMDSLDQGAVNLVVGTITYDKPVVRLEVGSIAGVFDGELDDNKSEITGDWNQPGASLPLTLKRADPKAEKAQEIAQDANKDYSHAGPNDLPGHWKGALDVKGMKLHLAIHVAKLPNGDLSGSLDSIDQGAKNISANAVTFTAPNAHLEWKAIGGTYDGTLENGKLSGTWRQGGQEFPLAFERSAKN